MPENETQIKGFVEDIIFRNAENGYSVIDVSSEGELITAVGIFSSVSVGEEITMKGSWTSHPTFGKQFKVTEAERNMPKTAADMLRYLSAGTVKGIGPATATKIVERFGEETFEVLENRPDLLSSIKGISEDKAQAICKEFKKQFAVREVMIYLEKFGMKSSECLAAYKAFGMGATDRIRENPYVLCSERVGIRFERVDEIAANFSEQRNPVYRQRAGVVYIIKHNLSNGHTCLPRAKIISPAAEFLCAGEDEIETIIDGLVEDKELVEKELEGESFLFLPAASSFEICKEESTSLTMSGAGFFAIPVRSPTAISNNPSKY